MPSAQSSVDHSLVIRLQEYIRQHQLDAGMRLPAERQLAAELGVSRSSLREAIRALNSAGMLVSRRGAGTSVRQPADLWSQQAIVQPLQPLMAQDPDYCYDVLEARYAIEASTARYAARRATADDKQKLLYCFDATLKFRENDDPALAASADARLHLAVAEAAHNSVLLQTMRGFFTLLHSSVMHSRERMFLQPAIFDQLADQHRQMVQAICAGDDDGARQAAIDHLRFVHRTLRRLDDDDARQVRLSRLSDLP